MTGLQEYPYLLKIILVKDIWIGGLIEHPKGTTCIPSYLEEILQEV